MKKHTGHGDCVLDIYAYVDRLFLLFLSFVPELILGQRLTWTRRPSSAERPTLSAGM